MSSTRSALSWTALAVLLALLGVWLASTSVDGAASSALAAAPHRTSPPAAEPQPLHDERATSDGATDSTARARHEVLRAGERVLDDTPRGELRVQVLDLDGEPAPQAEAWIEDEHASRTTVLAFADEYRSDVHELAAGLGLRLRLDSHARALVPAPRTAVRVAARAPGLAGCAVVAASEVDCVVQLARSHDVSVRVLDSTGQPIEGAFVGLTVPDPRAALLRRENSRMPALVARSDARGLAVLRDVESHASERESSWRIEPLLVRADPVSFSVDPKTPPDAPLEFRVDACGAVRVEVREPSGRLFSGESRVALGDRNWVLRSSVRASGGYAPEESLRHGVALFRCVGLMQDLTLHVDPALSMRRGALAAPALLRRGDEALVVLQLDR